MENFYSRLSYSFGNEDWNTEYKALRIQPSDSVLCITASGDRPLNLLTKELKELIAVDVNPVQNALFDLKRVALAKLSFPDYMAFIGVHPSKNRMQTLAEFAQDLDPMAIAFWEILQKKIEKGVIYEGSVEKLLKVASSIIRMFRGKKIDQLFAMKNLREQKIFLEKRWHTYLWKKIFQIGLHPLVTRHLIKDPGLYEHVDAKFHVGNQLYQRVHNYLNKHLAKESLLLSLLLKGRVDPHYFPPYLTEKGVYKIKKQVNKTCFITDNLVSYVTQAKENSIDCFSISDVASYLSLEQFNQLIEGVYRCAKPGARFCMRQFLSERHIPKPFAAFFKRNTHLEYQLQQEDRCFVYSFAVGTINK